MSRFESRSRRLLYALCFALLLPATAWSQVDTKQSISFGDSLTDNDLLYLLFGTDPLIYGNDPFEAVFLRASDHDDTLDNFAMAGSTSADVLDQVLAYAVARWSGQQTPATFISLQAGGNDVLETTNLLTLASAPPGESEAADAIIDHIRRNLILSLNILRNTDRGAVTVIWTVPDVTFSPYVLVFQLDNQSLQNISSHIDRLNQSIRQLSRQRHIAVLDISRVLAEVSNSPPTIENVTLVPPPLFGFGSAIFADVIHPTAVSNGLLANELIMTLNQNFGGQISLFSGSELRQLIGPTP